MPNIHGLASLIGLVFSPCAEFRTDKNKDRYTGAIIGLGWDPATGEPLLPDHDIELTFDFAFTQEDLVKVCFFASSNLPDCRSWPLCMHFISDQFLS